MSRTTPFDVFVPQVESYVDTSKAMLSKQSVETSKTINVNLSAAQFKSIFNPYDGTDVFNSTLILEALRSFFDIKSNYKLFASELKTIITYNYSNVNINQRKLNLLVKKDAGIFNMMFNSLTGLPFPGIDGQTTKVYEEIAYDIKNMVEERDDVSVTNFWSEVISGDSITVVIALDMSAFSSTNPTLMLFVKFNIVESTSQYTFSI